MLKLSGKVIRIHAVNVYKDLTLIKVSTNRNLPEILRRELAFLVCDHQIPTGFAHYLLTEQHQALVEELPVGSDYSILANDFSYIGDNDVIRLSADRQSIRVLFRASSPNNSILLTEQCNNYCLMCSQPPKSADDSWILDEIESLIPLIPKETRELGFTGGEPTTNKDRFLKIISLTKSYLPRTAIHILSNGRSFKDPTFAEKYAAIELSDAMTGIPVYSDDPTLHDYIVQAQGAFDETIQGILNLKRLGQRVEIRVVIHKLSVQRLPELCEFIARNLLFVDQVALMGLEMMGFTRANLDELWIDPIEYKDTLSKSVGILAKYGMNVSVYNHQLCLVNPDILPYYKKSISDWKNEFAPECQTCKKQRECGGFFASGVKFGYSKQLSPF
ncbi:His-Xaa-Ser system radical SAM maturase HxsC [Pseudomonas sp. ADAK2]|uniref:His-Xaa-Ser system radical SAM maturase HxsC n=1 Tax=unclassified Pseudomonas TaxID=196821 RepID=UPI0014638F54|nr:MULTISPECIES: His-Xaa-Ser system radical SAM maturase HxsC [unclassified Pseudomonas]QJI44997.1 His-Xaa-Ser system radical SAM maturase HxsC [Pseudomonas sp. ADAK7]QJI51298.1 His-Xaa-Ser system radical SAM maturase HxsC [Pseudomonas sp. ADAK2]